MVKGVAVGIALGTLTTPVGNSGFLLGAYAVSFVLQGLYRPQIDVYANASEFFTSAVQV